MGKLGAILLKLLKWPFFLALGLVALAALVWIYDSWNGKSEIDKLSVGMWVGLCGLGYFILKEIGENEARSKMRHDQIIELLQRENHRQFDYAEHDEILELIRQSRDRQSTFDEHAP